MLCGATKIISLQTLYLLSRSMEKQKQMSFGSSKLVPNIQELAKEPMTKLPPKYIRSDQEAPMILNPMESSMVPVIDMQKLLSEEDMELELNRLHLACIEWGFFQVLKNCAKCILHRRNDVLRDGDMQFFANFYHFSITP